MPGLRGRGSRGEGQERRESENNCALLGRESIGKIRAVIPLETPGRQISKFPPHYQEVCIFKHHDLASAKYWLRFNAVSLANPFCRRRDGLFLPVSPDLQGNVWFSPL